MYRLSLSFSIHPFQHKIVFFLIKTNDNQLHTTTDFQDVDIVINENMYVK